MFIKTKSAFNLVKVESKVNKTSGKTHNYLIVIDEERNTHRFYIKPSLVEVVNKFNYLDQIGVEFVVIYGTKDKEFDGLQVKNIYSPSGK